MYATNKSDDAGKPSGSGNRPIRLAGANLGDRAHICGFFSSREDAYRVLLPFVQEGLESGQKVVHTVDPRRREEHVRWLGISGIDVKRNNQFELRDWADSHLNGGLFNQDKTLALWEKIVEDAKEEGFPLVRFVSEMEWALEAELNMNDLLEYEAKANYVWLRGDGPYNPAICTYDLKRFRGDIVIDVMRTHPLAIIGGVLQENPFFVPPDEFLEQLRKKRDTV